MNRALLIDESPAAFAARTDQTTKATFWTALATCLGARVAGP